LEVVTSSDQQTVAELERSHRQPADIPVNAIVIDPRTTGGFLPATDHGVYQARTPE